MLVNGKKFFGNIKDLLQKLFSLPLSFSELSIDALFNNSKTGDLNEVDLNEDDLNEAKDLPLWKKEIKNRKKKEELDAKQKEILSFMDKTSKKTPGGQSR